VQWGGGTDAGTRLGSGNESTGRHVKEKHKVTRKLRSGGCVCRGEGKNGLEYSSRGIYTRVYTQEFNSPFFGGHLKLPPLGYLDRYYIQFHTSIRARQVSYYLYTLRQIASTTCMRWLIGLCPREATRHHTHSINQQGHSSQHLITAVPHSTTLECPGQGNN